MSWMLNQGPSFNVTRPGNSYHQLSGFSQRFMLTQDSTLLTPGKPEPHLPAETMKGTTKKRKHNRTNKPERCKNLVMPKYTLEPEYIYGGFAKSKQVQKRVRKKKMPKLKKRSLK